jgi:hypothetical protein
LNSSATMAPLPNYGAWKYPILILALIAFPPLWTFPRTMVDRRGFDPTSSAGSTRRGTKSFQNGISGQ